MRATVTRSETQRVLACGKMCMECTRFWLWSVTIMLSVNQEEVWNDMVYGTQSVKQYVPLKEAYLVHLLVATFRKQD